VDRCPGAASRKPHQSTIRAGGQIPAAKLAPRAFGHGFGGVSGARGRLPGGSVRCHRGGQRAVEGAPFAARGAGFRGENPNPRGEGGQTASSPKNNLGGSGPSGRPEHNKKTQGMGRPIRFAGTAGIAPGTHLAAQGSWRKNGRGSRRPSFRAKTPRGGPRPGPDVSAPAGGAGAPRRSAEIRKTSCRKRTPGGCGWGPRSPSGRRRVRQGDPGETGAGRAGLIRPGARSAIRPRGGQIWNPEVPGGPEGLRGASPFPEGAFVRGLFPPPGIFPGGPATGRA